MLLIKYMLLYGQLAQYCFVRSSAGGIVLKPDSV